jgi:hypothetical protein
LSPHFTITVATAWLFGIVALTAHQSPGAAKPVSLVVIVGAISAFVPLTVAGPTLAQSGRGVG